MTVEYKKKNFTLYLKGEKILVATSLQVFLLSAPQYNGYLQKIRDDADKIKDWDQLCSYFYHEERGDKVVSMIPTRKEWHLND